MPCTGLNLSSGICWPEVAEETVLASLTGVTGIQVCERTTGSQGKFTGPRGGHRALTGSAHSREEFSEYCKEGEEVQDPQKRWKVEKGQVQLAWLIHLRAAQRP